METDYKKAMSDFDQTQKPAKSIHAKPSYYAYIFNYLKEIAKEYGYNLVLHGSLNRDLDLIAIPWEKEIKDHTEMVYAFCEYLGGSMLAGDRFEEDGINKILPYSRHQHGRMIYVINLNREGKMVNDVWTDPQYYLDISVIPSLPQITDKVFIVKYKYSYPPYNQKEKEVIAKSREDAINLFWKTRSADDYEDVFAVEK